MSMNPYPDRLEELHCWLADRFGQRDRQATEILLSGQLSRPGQSRPPWLIIETDYPSRDMTSGWFSFGGQVKALSMAVPRVQRSQVCEEIMQGWLADRSVGRCGLFVESEWRKPPRLSPVQMWGKFGHRAQRTHTYAILLSQCIRVRVEHPRTDHVIRDGREADLRELGRLTGRVLDCYMRSNQTPNGSALISPGQATWQGAGPSDVPKSFLYWCELLQRIAPLQTDWESLLMNLSGVARGIGYLRGDGVADWAAALRCFRDCVPALAVELMLEAAVGRVAGRERLKSYKQSGRGEDTVMVEEVKRLHAAGVLLARRNFVKVNDGYRWHPWRYRIGSQDWRDLIDRSKALW